MRRNITSVLLVFCFFSGCSDGEGPKSTLPPTAICEPGQCKENSANVDAYMPSVDASGNFSVRSVDAGAAISVIPCSEIPAPLSACSAAAKVTILKPKHLGCTTPDTHAWLCYDAYSGAPPYPVVSCSGPYSSSCKLLGNIQ